MVVLSIAMVAAYTTEQRRKAARAFHPTLEVPLRLKHSSKIILGGITRARAVARVVAMKMIPTIVKGIHSPKKVRKTFCTSNKS